MSIIVFLVDVVIIPESGCKYQDCSVERLANNYSENAFL